MQEEWKGDEGVKVHDGWIFQVFRLFHRSHIFSPYNPFFAVLFRVSGFLDISVKQSKCCQVTCIFQVRADAR